MALNAKEALELAVNNSTIRINKDKWMDAFNNIYTGDKLRYHIDNPPVIKGGAVFIVTRPPALFTQLDMSDNFGVAFMSYVKTAPNGENASLSSEDIEGSAYAHTGGVAMTGAEQRPSQDLTLTFKHDGLYIMSTIINIWVNTMINMHTGESEIARKMNAFPGDFFNSMDYLLVKNSSTNYDDNVSSVQYFRNVRPLIETGAEELEISPTRELIQDISVNFKGQYVHRSTLVKMDFDVAKEAAKGLVNFRQKMLDSKLSIGETRPPVVQLKV